MHVRVERILGSPRAIWLCAAIAFILSLRALGIGLQTDDHVLKAQLEANTGALDNKVTLAPVSLW